MEQLVLERIKESIRIKQGLLQNHQLLEVVTSLAEKMSNCIQNQGKLVVCGNGGSASDALHFAGEVIGRFQKDRKAWPVVVLNSDVATMTAIANDYGYEEIFARQVEAHVNPNDIFFGISTSGNSQNVYRGFLAAKDIGATTAALLGKDGGIIRDIADYAVIVPCAVTARVQECHILLIHILCELLEEIMLEDQCK